MPYKGSSEHREYMKRWAREKRARLKAEDPAGYEMMREKERQRIAALLLADPQRNARNAKHARDYRASNREKVKEYDRSEPRRARHRARYHADPEAAKAKTRRWQEQNPEKHKAGKLASRLKAKAREFPGFRPIPADNRCECCGDDVTGHKHGPHCDHCHGKGHFRGWLCYACNTALGYAKDNLLRLCKIMDYLRRDRARQKKAGRFA